MAKLNAFVREKGWIEVICGPMFAGKSEELLRKLNRLKYADVDYLVFKPKMDSRSIKKIHSRRGISEHAIELENPLEIYDHILSSTKNIQVIAIDEVQFIDSSIVEICDNLANQGIIVYVSGLDMDFRGEPFQTTMLFLAKAEKIIKLTAICTECGAPGTKSQRLINDHPANYDDDLVLIGNLDSYTVKCRKHHKVLRKKQSAEFKKFNDNFANKKL